MSTFYKRSFLLCGAALLLPALLLLAGCSRQIDEEQPSAAAGRSAVTFAFGTLAGEIDSGGPATRSLPVRESLTALRYAIFDASGRPVEHRWAVLAEDFTNLTLEGLMDGRYSIVFFATTDEDTDAFRPAMEGNDYTLSAPSADAPLNGDYLFARMEFEAGADAPTEALPVTLTRCVGRVDVAVNVIHPYTGYLIDKVEIAFDEGARVYTAKTGADGGYEGAGTLPTMDLTAERAFYSLPSPGPLSGTVTVESSCDGEPVVNAYRFEGLSIEPGKRAAIDIDWESAVGDRGFFRVFESDYTTENSCLILQDNEPREVFYDPAQRSFQTNRPLQVKVNDRQELQLDSYTPIDITDVTVLCRFKRYSPEFFPLAHYEKVRGFSESRMRIPLADRALTFTAADGRNVVIPAQPELGDDDCEFRVESTHPYLQKVATITNPCQVSFSPYGANNPDPGYYRHMTPELCRHGAVLMVNMSYMFHTQEFRDGIINWTGTGDTDFLDNNRNPIDRELLIRQAQGVDWVKLGTVAGVGGLGAGGTYCLAPYCYTFQYWDTESWNSYAKEATFHEFSHRMGYSHESTMTYGAAWVPCVQRIWYDLGAAGKLPVSNSKWETNYR